MRVLFLDTVHDALEKILTGAGFSIGEDYVSSPVEIAAKFPDAEGIVIRSRFKIEEDFLEALPDLKFIARAGAGMENIDVAACERRGILCLHAPEGNRDAVAEHAMGMLLALFNNLIRADREVRQGIWHREENRGMELNGKTVGIIGYGNTGSAFARRLSGFGVNVLAFDKFKKGFGNALVKEVSMEELQREAQIISLHVPLSDSTRYLVNESFISEVASPFVLINTSRGKVVNTEALAEGLKSGKVVGACLDVLEYEAVSFEKLDRDSLPSAFRYLASCDRVVLSPHVAGWTFESHRKISEVLARKILLAFGDLQTGS